MLQRPGLRGALFAALLLLAPLSALGAGLVGETAAPFSLNDTNGINHVLSNHQGEVVYLFFVGHS